MKKYTAYIIALLLALAIIGLFVTGNNKTTRRLDERISLRRQDKIPYGTFVAFRNLKHLFPAASVYTSRQIPGYWDSLSNYDTRQAYMVIADRFNADESEMKRLIAFAKQGNDVFISARYLSSAADNILGCVSSSYDLSIISMGDIEDDMKVTLKDPPFAGSTYGYPGKAFSSYFSSIDTATTNVLGYDGAKRSVFIHLRTGKGNFYIHLEPMAFSNYFLLHKNNIEYYEKALSVINPGVTKIVWDEYYMAKRQNDQRQEKKGWFSVLMNIKNDAGRKPFRAAFWLSIALLLVYVLMEMRRKQRYIPVVRKPKNDSLDFVKTIGRLYYDKGDHQNLGRKMSAYFLEHVRNKYKLKTGTLDEEFIKNLQFKSGVEEATIREIISFIKYNEETPVISQRQLTDFHKQLELFYQKA